MIKRLLLTLSSAALLAMPVAAQAGLLASDAFDYPAETSLDGANGGTGWGGAWSFTSNGTTAASVNSQNMDVPVNVALPTGNQVNLLTYTSGSVRVERDLATSINTNVSDTLYMSMVFRREDSSNGGGSENSEFLRLDNASNVRVATIGQASDEVLRLHLGGTYVNFGTTVEIGTDYLLVGKLTMNPAGTDDVLEAQLFKSTDTVFEPAVWQGQVAVDFSDVATKFVVSQARLADQLRMDEIRIGETFADVTPLPLPGDLDLDGFVGIADLNIVLGTWNEDVPLGSLADPTGDGFVGIADLNTVLGNWNAGTPPTAAASVPEPSSLLAVLGLGSLATLRRRG